MDLGSPVALLSVCAVLTCLLGAARVSSDENSCPCPDIPIRNDSLLPPTACRKIDDTFRYTCKEHTVRKAGTSNLIKCKIMPIINGAPQWSNLSLQCIPDPKRSTKQPPKSTATTDPNRTTTQSPASTVTKGHTDIPHDFTIATTVTAPSRETESLSPAASVSAEPTSPGLQAPAGPSPAKEEEEVATETEATQRTTATSTAAEPSDDGTPDAHTFPPAARIALIICALVVIVCALIGINFFYYKRRPTDKRQKPQSTEEEEVALNNVGPKQ